LPAAVARPTVVFGKAFNDNRYFHITWLILPVIGLLERAGCRSGRGC
jgi:uncharacterized membrane protein